MSTTTSQTNWLERRRRHAARVRKTWNGSFSDTPPVTVIAERWTGKTEMVLDRALRHAQEGLQVIYCGATMRSAEEVFRRTLSRQPNAFAYRAVGNVHLKFANGGALHFKAATAHNFDNRWDVAIFDDVKPVAFGGRVKLVYRVVTAEQLSEYIAAVLEAHQTVATDLPLRCTCGDWQDNGPGENRRTYNYQEHVADVLAAAISGQESDAASEAAKR